MRSKVLVVFLAVAVLATMAGLVQAKEAAKDKEPIKIGAFFALSGPAAAIGTPTKYVAEMVVDKINKEGGINGRPLVLVIGDTESDAAKAATIAKKFIHQDKVAAIIGPTRTDTGMNVKKIVEEHNGTVSIANLPSRGAMVAITLPVVAAQSVARPVAGEAGR